MKNKLTRSRTDSKLAGVCGGLANYLNIDVVIIRILWVVSAFLGGPSIGVYIIAAIIIPKEKLGDSTNKEERTDEPTFEPLRYDEDIESDDVREESDYEEDLNEQTDYSRYEENEEKHDFNIAYLGIGLIGLGAFLAFKAIFPWFEYKFLWPGILIVGGLLLLSKNNDVKEND